MLDASSSISSSSQTRIKPEIEERATSNGLRVFPGAAGADDGFHPVVFKTGPGPAKQPVAFLDVTLLSPDIQSVPTTPAPSLHSSGTKKLKKVKKGIADGYDSDGGYLSEVVSKKKDKKKKKSKDGDSTVDGNVIQNGSLMVPEERKRKKSLVDVVRGSTKKKPKETDGYATDGASMKIKKAKPKFKDIDAASFETDGGSIKSKTRSFFKLSSKSSKPDFAKDDDIPAVPLLKETRPLPIAQRFATASNSQNGSESPVDDPERPKSLAVSLPSAISSRSTVNEIPPSTGDGALPSLSFQPFNTTSDMADMSTFSRSESPPPPAAPAQPPSQQHSVPPVSFSHALRTGAVRDSQASSGSSSSGAGTLSPSMSSSVTSPATSHSHFQIPAPRSGHGLGTGSTTTGVPQHNSVHGYSFVPKTDGLSTAGPPKRMSSSRLPSPPAVGIPTGMKPMTFQIARDISTVPLMMQQQQQQQMEPEPQDDDRPPSRIQPVANDEVEKPPKRLSSLAPVVPLNIGKAGGLGLKLKPSLEKINLLGLRKEGKESTAVGSVPSPISPHPEMATSWKFPLSTGQYDFPHSPMHPLSPGRSRNGRPMSPPDKSSPATQTLSPHAFISPPNTAVTSPAPPVSATSRLRPPVIMTSSPRSNAPPNVLAYYDIPPPSPPPMGPLPLPPQLNGDGNIMAKRSPSPLPPRNRSRSPVPPPPGHSGPDVSHLPNPAQLRQRFLDRTPRPLPVDDATRSPSAFGRNVGTPLNPNIKRGRESPFPSEPVFIRPLVPLNSSSSVSDESVGSEEGTKKFRDPSPQPPPSGHPASVRHWDSRVPSNIGKNKPVERRISWVDFKDILGKSIDDGLENENQDNFDNSDGVRGSLDANGSVISEDSDIRGILDRFSIHPNRSEESVHSDKALARSRSSEALNSTNTNPSRSRFAWDDATTAGDRTSRWSGSIYSRMSIMDEEESNAARDRFVERVEAMLAAEERRKNGGIESDNDRDHPATGEGIGNSIARRGSRGNPRGRDEYIPPVPKIPEVFANTATLRSDMVSAGPTWNKF